MIFNYPTLTGSELNWVNSIPWALPVAAATGAVAAGRQTDSHVSDEDHTAKPIDNNAS